MHMGLALQLLFTGLGVGSIYALVALGFVLIYRATNVVNFAQGDFAMLGAFSMVVLCIDLQLPYWFGILITLVALRNKATAFGYDLALRVGAIMMQQLQSTRIRLLDICEVSQ
jgi:branched-chain amino acid transport system permease protein